MKKGNHYPQPQRSLTDSDIQENGSVNNIVNILFRQRAVPHILSHDKTANMDGNIELVDTDGRPTGMIHVQVKTYQNRYGGIAKHPVPAYIAGYAHNLSNELVMLIVSDYDRSLFYWTVIDSEWFSYFQRSGAKTKTHLFSTEETAHKENIGETLIKWQRLYDEKIAVFKDEKEKASAFIESQKYPFLTISRVFHGIPTSHIERKETSILKKWIVSPLEKGQKPVMILSGAAGCGKSVVIRDLIDYLDAQSIPYLPIKADQVESINPDKICTVLSVIYKDAGKCVLLIDQLDALSRYMSNDRDLLNKILSTIAFICKDWDPDNIRIIVSCREFDLQNDSRIHKVLTDTPIRMGQLSDEEVQYVLEQLESNLYAQLLPSQKTLLSTPQYLDTFCRIYHQCKFPLSIQTSIELYDALWHEITHPSNPSGIELEEIETVLYSVSDAILNAETLNPVKVFSGRDVRVAEYLESEDIIRRKDRRISFFHQTFYEYVYARSVESQGIRLLNIVTQRHQGLFLRNTVKHLIDYLKGKDPKRYVKEATDLLCSPIVRKHIKTLVLDTMAFSTEIGYTEQDLIAELARNDTELFQYFLRKAWSDAWFLPLMEILSEHLPHLNDSSPIYFPTLSFFSHFCEKHTDAVFSGIGMIHDESTQKNSARYLLRSLCDYNHREVLKWYEQLKPTLPLPFRIDCISKAARNNLAFALAQASELIDMSLEFGRKERPDFHIMEHLFQDLAKRFPEAFYQALKGRLMYYIDNQRIKSYHSALDSASFGDFYGSESGLDLLKMLSSLLKARESIFRKKEVLDWLSHKEDYSSAAAFEIMAESPGDYIQEVKTILEDTEYTSQILESLESEFWFRSLLPMWYNIADRDTRNWYQSYLLVFSSPLDKIPVRERNGFRRYYYPFLGEQQWKLIHSLSVEEMDTPIKNKMHELNRRFGKKPDLRKNQHHASTAYVCDRLIPKEICMRFSEKRWEEFILHSEDYKESRPNGRWHPIDERLNVEDFAEYIASNAKKHSLFVDRIIANPLIKQEYKIAGLKGLAKGGISPSHIEVLMGKVDGIDWQRYEYTEIIELITEEDSEVIDHMIPKLTFFACRNDYEASTRDGKDDEEQNLNKIINHVINSVQGRALLRLIDIAHIESRRKEIYSILIEIKEKLHNELRLYAIWELYRKEYYDEDLFKVFLKEYLSSPEPEFLLLNGQCIYNFYVSYPGVVDDYLDSMADVQVCHSLLAQIYFLAHNHNRLSQIADQKLARLVKSKENKCFRTLSKICIENLRDSDYRDYAIHLLKSILENDSTEHSASKQLFHSSDQFATEDFPLFCKLLKISAPTAKTHGHHLFSYLERCIPNYPRLCYECIQYIDVSANDESYDEESFILLLLKLYTVLKEKADKKTMDNIMDIFDKHILLDNYGLRQALEEMEKQ